ncbi:bacillithiol biosynthesis cysteine-adding enzyme BshC [Alkalibacillus silvisoli]|uniref:Putative cysteine ligase BshC n=1 Tax=Alkalibacillus silvisoli TaxID=392823 RepID=A0ABN0ZVN6_9BACI
MEAKPIELTQQANLIKDYRDRKESIYKHFQYDPFQLRSFRSRYEYLMGQTYKREALVKVLKEQNERWVMTSKVQQNIEALLDEKSTVVIGGQQTGLLTGPLYTIHKIVSIIIQANEMSEYLKSPVIPVFWMAGEDHDFLEIDHVFTYQDQELNKVRIDDETPFDYKSPISKREIPVVEAERFIDQVFETFQETEHTKELYETVRQSLNNSKTYVDFFACFLNQLFEKDGLVLVDADERNLRMLERDYFIRMVENREDIATKTAERLKALTASGYHINLDAKSTDAHLFYHHDGERLLLEVDTNGRYRSKGGEVSFLEAELKELIYHSPEQFSNNVVTRPLMQEFVFPVLSFVGGPGEIGYWSSLKGAFEAVNLQLPIVTPRLSLTLMKRNHQSIMNQYHVDETDLINNGTYQDKMSWLKRQSKYPLEETVQQVKKQMEVAHQPLQEIAQSVSNDMAALTETNLKQIEDEINYVEKKLYHAIKGQHQDVVLRFDDLDSFYYPLGGLQERVWNVVYWLNEYGLDLPESLTKIPPRFEQDHQIVIL